MASAHHRCMNRIRLLAAAAIAISGCYAQQPAAVQYAEPMQYSGPPGGEMDPSSVPTEAQYEQDSQPPEQQAVPQAYADGTAQGYAPDDQSAAPGADAEPAPRA